MKVLEATKYYEGFNPEDLRVARRMAEEAIAMRPRFPEAYIVLGYVSALEYWTNPEKSTQQTIEEGTELAQKALAINASMAGGHTLQCIFHTFKREYDKAIAEGERAIALSPGSALDHQLYGFCAGLADRPEKSISLIKKAIRLNPFSPPHTFIHLATSLRTMGKFEEAASAGKKAIQLRPDNLGAHANLALTYSTMGKEKEASAEGKEVLRINPKFSVYGYSEKSFLICKNQSEWDKYNIKPLRGVGLK